MIVLSNDPFHIYPLSFAADDDIETLFWGFTSDAGKFMAPEREGQIDHTNIGKSLVLLMIRCLETREEHWLASLKNM